MKMLGLLFIGSFVFWAGVSFVAKQRYAKLQQAILNHDMKTFDSYTSSFWTKALVSNDKIFMLRFSDAIMNSKKKRLYHMEKALRQETITKNTKKKAYSMLFQHYVEERMENLDSLFEDMKQVFHEDEIKEMRVLYEIDVLKSSVYIDEMLEQIELCEKEERGMLAYLVAKQYENLNQMQKRKSYLKMAYSDMQDTPFAKVLLHEMKEL